MSEIGENETPEPMQRLTLTPEQQTLVAEYRTANGVQSSDTVVEGTSLKVDDHLQIDGSWNCIAVRGAGGDAIDILVPDWGDFIFPCSVTNYITNRAGPNGETMPIYDEQQMQAMLAAKKQNPKDAQPSSVDALRESLKRADKETAQKLRRALHEHGILKQDKT